MGQNNAHDQLHHHTDFDTPCAGDGHINGQWFIGAIIDNITGNILEICCMFKRENTHELWETSFTNEIGRLFQGIHHLKGMDTCFFHLE
jgi:hypothetical protein